MAATRRARRCAYGPCAASGRLVGYGEPRRGGVAGGGVTTGVNGVEAPFDDFRPCGLNALEERVDPAPERGIRTALVAIHRLPPQTEAAGAAPPRRPRTHGRSSAPSRDHRRA